VFNKVMAKVGAGGARVETTLTNSSVYPGGTVEGVIDITGGEVDQHVEYVAASLVARVEVESGDSEYDQMLSFWEQRLTGAFQLAPGAQYQLPLQLQVPHETPFNVINNQQLPRCFVGVRTELEIARSRDQRDIDPIYVYALPAHERLLQSFFELGFQFKDADYERGRIPGSTLPFYQEVEFYSSPQYAHRFNEVEVTFLTRHDAMDVILEIDKRGGFLTGSHDQVSRFSVGFHQLDQFDWTTALNQYLAQLV
jgi:sporulation-control protein